MGSALEEFRAQRQAVEDVHTRLTEVANLLRAIRQEAVEVANDAALRKLLNEEQTWLLRAQDLVRQVQYFREAETSRFWPSTWRRWVMAVALAMVTAFAAGVGYVWAGRPYQAEIADLRTRVAFGGSVAQRVVRMTPGERRQFDALMKWNDGSKH